MVLLFKCFKHNAHFKALVISRSCVCPNFNRHELLFHEKKGNRAPYINALLFAHLVPKQWQLQTWLIQFWNPLLMETGIG